MVNRLLPCLILLPCAALAGGSVPIGQPFPLGVAETTVVGSQVEVEFVEILADSRCPADVVCFWQGDAAASLVVRPLGHDPASIVLHTYDAWGRELEFGPWRIALLGVAPYPSIAAGPIDPATYVVTLRIDALGPVDGVPTTWSTVKARYR